jgi:hypothetical protein
MTDTEQQTYQLCVQIYVPEREELLREEFSKERIFRGRIIWGRTESNSIL